MGRHSRRDPAEATDNSSTSGTPVSHGTGPQAAPGTGRRRRGAADETPAHGTPAHGTPAHGTPVPPVDGAARSVPSQTPPHGVPHVRGGHPEQREPGGGWGDATGTGTGASTNADPGTGRGPRIRRGRGLPGPRQDYVAAFPDDEGDPVGTGEPAARPPRPRDPYASVTDWDAVPEPADDGGGRGGKKGGRRRTVAGVAVAAAVTGVLGVIVAGQLAGGGKGADTRTKAAPGGTRDTDDPASRSDRRPTPAEAKKDEPPATYEQKMGEKNPMDAKLKASGDFEAIPGFEKAPGKGRLFRYRVDVEKGLGLDGGLFAQAVQKTLNDDRSWAHAGARTFERISSGKPDFVITLASPGTTAAWCAKSGLDTTQDNVSCDSAATERVMINAYRWAQGAKTYGDAVQKEYGSAIFPYRQMLINHEVGHRLGFNHTDCTKDGGLAPVMQQQTKFLNHDGIKCKANPWAFPKS
ncbi:DUF3152 domain-containing protein [Streptomyces sp. NPDC029674]|uniref:DUF3152 domain-containing protein n=1 Tax=Streptomyces sp. NPDC029674 TaxID=3365297 RepID=UPI00384D69C3